MPVAGWQLPLCPLPPQPAHTFPWTISTLLIRPTTARPELQAWLHAAQHCGCTRAKNDSGDPPHTLLSSSRPVAVGHFHDPMLPLLSHCMHSQLAPMLACNGWWRSGSCAMQGPLPSQTMHPSPSSNLGAAPLTTSLVPTCLPAVVAVGYVTSGSEKYWIVRNSCELNGPDPCPNCPLPPCRNKHWIIRNSCGSNTDPAGFPCLLTFGMTFACSLPPG